MLQPPTADQLKDPHWAEVHRLMSEATAEEAELSSDEEGAADRLMDGLLPVGAPRSRSADGPAGPSGVARRTSDVAMARGELNFSASARELAWSA